MLLTIGAPFISVPVLSLSSASTPTMISSNLVVSLMTLSTAIVKYDGLKERSSTMTMLAAGTTIILAALLAKIAIPQKKRLFAPVYKHLRFYSWVHFRRRNRKTNQIIFKMSKHKFIFRVAPLVILCRLFSLPTTQSTCVALISWSINFSH